MKNKLIIFISLLFLLLQCKAFGQKPEKPTIDSVSVNNQTNTVFLSWTIDSVPRIDSIIIYREITGVDGIIDGNFPIDTVAGTVFTYEDHTISYREANPSARSEKYQIAALSESVLSNISDTHGTIFLQNISFDECKLETSISWTAYSGWGNSLESQTVYYSVDGGKYEAAGVISSAETSFTHRNVKGNSNYKYFVRAENSKGFTSSSNMLDVETNVPQQAEKVNLDYVSVTSNNTIELSLTFDTIADVKEYQLMKENGTVAFETIATYDNSQEKAIFVDSVSSVTTLHNYKLAAINSCGQKAIETDVSHNIILIASEVPSDNNLIHLKWISYASYLGNVDLYEIYRSLEDGEYELLTTVPGTNNEYEDNISAYLSKEAGNIPVSKYSYYVVAIEGDTNPHGVKGESKSNEVYINKIIGVTIPNAFNPLSSIEKNRIFKPYLNDVSNYSMIIYSRWGNKIFETTNPDEGWDGKVNGGKLAAEGVYVYLISYTDDAKGDIEKVGQVSVIYP